LTGAVAGGLILLSGLIVSMTVVVAGARATAEAHAADISSGPHARAAAASTSGSPRAQRSAALFEQMLPVLRYPRCMNCHTDTEFPRQGDDRHRHIMNVSRGPDDHGAVGLRCGTCHQSTNQPASGVPGAADWHLAPRSMAWEGLTGSQLCRVLFDPRKGALKPSQLVPHLETPFVVWAWSPGVDAHGRPRSTPPMSHQAFVALARRWVATGAVCP
jgi:hypothetical protein